MTDRELLEKAAKAAGMEIKWDQLRGEKSGRLRARLPGSGDAFPYWNPLTDDGDALRLAVKLNLNLRFGAHWVLVHNRDVEASQSLSEDPCAATRRAIVRAAAIGEKS